MYKTNLLSDSLFPKVRAPQPADQGFTAAVLPKGVSWVKARDLMKKAFEEPFTWMSYNLALFGKVQGSSIVLARNGYAFLFREDGSVNCLTHKKEPYRFHSGDARFTYPLPEEGSEREPWPKEPAPVWDPLPPPTPPKFSVGVGLSQCGDYWRTCCHHVIPLRLMSDADLQLCIEIMERRRRKFSLGTPRYMQFTRDISLTKIAKRRSADVPGIT